MKANTLVMAAVALMGLTGAWLGGARAASAQDVSITLTGVQARGGQLLASLQTEADFMQPRASYGVTQVVTAPGTVTLTFTNVSPGAYALSVMHDENGDYQMQREEDGRPREGWAMSHGAAVAALHARPTFAVARIDVGASNLALTEPMFYPAAR